MIFTKKRRAGSAGYAVGVVIIGLLLFGLLYIGINFIAGQVNGITNANWPSQSGVYDTNTNIGMNVLLYPGIAIMVMFGAVIEVINITQKKNSADEYI